MARDVTCSKLYLDEKKYDEASSDEQILFLLAKFLCRFATYVNKN